jgi:hypothetical protein
MNILPFSYQKYTSTLFSRSLLRIHPGRKITSAELAPAMIFIDSRGSRLLGQQSEQMYSVGVGVGEWTGVGVPPGLTGSVFMPVLDGLAWMFVSSG